MPTLPEPTPARPRPDETSADMETLIHLGIVEEQPTPSEPEPPTGALPE